MERADVCGEALGASAEHLNAFKVFEGDTTPSSLHHTWALWTSFVKDPQIKIYPSSIIACVAFCPYPALLCSKAGQAPTLRHPATEQCTAERLAADRGMRGLLGRWPHWLPPPPPPPPPATATATATTARTTTTTTTTTRTTTTIAPTTTATNH